MARKSFLEDHQHSELNEKRQTLDSSNLFTDFHNFRSDISFEVVDDIHPFLSCLTSMEDRSTMNSKSELRMKYLSGHRVHWCFTVKEKNNLQLKRQKTRIRFLRWRSLQRNRQINQRLFKKKMESDEDFVPADDSFPNVHNRGEDSLLYRWDFYLIVNHGEFPLDIDDHQWHNWLQIKFEDEWEEE